jgi:hypothetical protein
MWCRVCWLVGTNGTCCLRFHSTEEGCHIPRTRVWVVRHLRFSQRCYWGFRPSGMWRLVVAGVVPDFSKELSSFIFRGQRRELHDLRRWSHHVVWRRREPHTQEFSVWFLTTLNLGILAVFPIDVRVHSSIVTPRTWPQWRHSTVCESSSEYHIIIFFNRCLSVHVDNYTIIVPTKCTSFY